ncbi:hypothetical protein CR201_G0027213 [Pongo abelii]|uniref:Uncharacterized protein n=1 Tax=Pongo abelii TaxID=9601 RepID=A0A2J8UKK2_PONAB|nr:hypothetical protein CR201_G0027213 [Pongo abelii]
MRKIHLQPQVLRPTSPRNISPISNPISGFLDKGDTFYPWTQNSGASHGLGKAALPWCLFVVETPLLLFTHVPLDPTENLTVQLTWQPLPEPLELWPKAL